ncbi:hypothetical protein SCT_1497 [Sulfuricella sp. T08]|uniref:hypothetical protein n=1 Tax=Sulfuricella sp. T08 TaxID=1632857 RepID=UPI00061799F8|nr:hypothetical protein [Sulfuricella sp. T08]GAO36098.1 hypothetical protein SCT_1497 [Sulfuricella sp. T08]
MSNKNTKPGNGEDRRAKSRRNKESGPPPGWKERRLSTEKRQPEVAEGSLEEWEALMGKSHTQVVTETQDESVLTDWEGLKHL